jgi:hypothetical protein
MFSLSVLVLAEAAAEQQLSLLWSLPFGLLLACMGLTQDSVSRCALRCIERPRRTLTGVLARILRAEQDRTFVSGTQCQ